MNSAFIGTTATIPVHSSSLPLNNNVAFKSKLVKFSVVRPVGHAAAAGMNFL